MRVRSLADLPSCEDAYRALLATSCALRGQEGSRETCYWE
jgi:hypothetical protein